MNTEKIRFVILKETEEGDLFDNVKEENFEKLDLGFGWVEFVEQVNYLVREKYLTRPLYAEDTIFYYNSMLTERGEIYLENNKFHKKAYKFAKEIKEWISL